MEQNQQGGTGTNLMQLKNTLNAPNVKKKFEDMLGKRASQFMTSITSVVSQSQLLQKADVNSIVMGAAVAASMDLPLNPALGYAALVPYNDTKKGGCYAQFQVMRNGWVELLIRSGQCVSVINEVVREGELIEYNKFTGVAKFQDNHDESKPIIGFMAYFKLTNGFEKTLYMTKEEVVAHATRYSQSYRNKSGNWQKDFEGMALKTVLKRLITKFAPKSLERILDAIEYDQSVVSGDASKMDINDARPRYMDSEDDNRKVEDAEAEEIKVDEAKQAPTEPAKSSTTAGTSTSSSRQAPTVLFNQPEDEY